MAIRRLLEPFFGRQIAAASSFLSHDDGAGETGSCPTVPVAEEAEPIRRERHRASREVFFPEKDAQPSVPETFLYRKTDARAFAAGKPDLPRFRDVFDFVIAFREQDLAHIHGRTKPSS